MAKLEQVYWYGHISSSVAAILSVQLLPCRHFFNMTGESAAGPRRTFTKSICTAS